MRLALAWFLGLITSPSTQADTTRPEQKAVVMNGAFRFSGSSVQTDEIERQIEAAVAAMDFFIRPLARYRLRQLTEPAQTFAFEPIDGGVMVVNELVERPCSFSGGVNDFTNRLGVEMQSVCTPLVAGIREEFKGLDSGEWAHEFRLSVDGSELTQSVWVTSPKLSQPLEFSLTYIRL